MFSKTPFIQELQRLTGADHYYNDRIKTGSSIKLVDVKLTAKMKAKIEAMPCVIKVVAPPTPKTERVFRHGRHITRTVRRRMFEGYRIHTNKHTSQITKKDWKVS